GRVEPLDRPRAAKGAHLRRMLVRGERRYQDGEHPGPSEGAEAPGHRKREVAPVLRELEGRGRGNGVREIAWRPPEAGTGDVTFGPVLTAVRPLDHQHAQVGDAVPHDH